MRRRYRLYYDMPPTRPGETHKVEIRLAESARRAHPEAHVVARKGYIAPNPLNRNAVNSPK